MVDDWRPVPGCDCATCEESRRVDPRPVVEIRTGDPDVGITLRIASDWAAKRWPGQVRR